MCKCVVGLEKHCEHGNCYPAKLCEEAVFIGRELSTIRDGTSFATKSNTQASNVNLTVFHGDGSGTWLWFAVRAKKLQELFMEFPKINQSSKRNVDAVSSCHFDPLGERRWAG